MLLDIADGELHVEVIDVGLRDFFQSEKDGLKPGQFAYTFDLLVQAPQLVERFQVVKSHDVILHS